MRKLLPVSNRSLRIIFVFLLLLTASAALTQTTFAQQFLQNILVDPDEGSPPLNQNTILNDSQPDSDGYTGLIDQFVSPGTLGDNDPDESPTNDPGGNIVGPDQDNYQGEISVPAAPVSAPQGNPDADPAVDFPEMYVDPNAPDNSIDAVDAWSGFYYVFVAGSSLHSADYSMRQVYNPGSCASVLDTGNEFITLNLDLQDGARIDYLRIYFYDTSASDSGASIRKYDGVGNTAIITSVNSSGTGGYGTLLSPYSGHIVDNLDGGYVLNWLPSVTGTSMRLCGLRVAYRLPIP